MAVAEAPSEMKTIEKPSTKASDIMTARRFALAEVRAAAAPAPRISSRVTPETNETYPGMRGRTQGEIKDRIPATNAAKSETSCIYSTGFSLITPGGPPSPGRDAGAGGSELGSSAPFNGGRS